MAETFEELLSRRLPALYAGARFLAGGRDALAEDLLADAVIQAFSRYGTWAWDPTSLERALVEEALHRWRLRLPPIDGTGEGTPSRRLEEGSFPPPGDVEGAFERLDAATFHRAAGRVPGLARIAIWLVTLEGWTYDDAGHTLGISRGELVELLEWRDELILRALRARPAPDRATGSS